MAMSLKKKLRAGKSVVGTMLCLVSNSDIVWILKNAGFDYIFIDCEHGAYTFQDVARLVSMCRALEVGVIVRVPQPDRHSIQKYSDMGIDGIMLPMVETAEQAELAVKYARYTPRGSRGISLGPLISYKTGVNLAEVISEVNDNYIILTQIETRKGVENIEQIMSVPGVDGVFFGVYDMSVSYGKPGEIYDPIFRKNISHVLESAKRHDKILGHHFFDYEDLGWGIDQGVKLIGWHTDVTFLQHFYQTELDKIKSYPKFIQ